TLSVGGHCAVRIVSEEYGLDLVAELIPDRGGIKQIYVESKGGPKTSKYSASSWIPVVVPSELSESDFDLAVLTSLAGRAGMEHGAKYGMRGQRNSNRFIYDVVVGAGGVMPAGVSGGYLIAPGICGGNWSRRGKC